jgi:Cof subfamily protein (haloacid dehalogenase superfamily)
MPSVIQGISARPKILFSDLDRTFLTHDYKVHPRNAAALDSARAAGLQVVFVTARAPNSLRRVVGPLGWQGRAICFNGGWIGDLESGKVSAAAYLPAEIAAGIMVDAQKEGADVVWYGEEILVQAMTPAVTWQLGKVGEQARTVTDLRSLELGPYKLLCIDRRDKTCFDALRQRWSDSAWLAQSHQMLLEIGPIGVSKGNAVRSVMAELGLDPGACAAIGDAENDLSMLEAVGSPATVANAIDAVKQHAVFVGGSCDAGGFADVIDWLLGTPPRGGARPLSLAP